MSYVFYRTIFDDAHFNFMLLNARGFTMSTTVMFLWMIVAQAHSTDDDSQNYKCGENKKCNTPSYHSS